MKIKDDFIEGFKAGTLGISLLFIEAYKFGFFLLGAFIPILAIGLILIWVVSLLFGD